MAEFRQYTLSARHEHVVKDVHVGLLINERVSPELEAGADLCQHASHSLQRDLYSQCQQWEG